MSSSLCRVPSVDACGVGFSPTHAVLFPSLQALQRVPLLSFRCWGLSWRSHVCTLVTPICQTSRVRCLPYNMHKPAQGVLLAWLRIPVQDVYEEAC